MAEVTAEIKGSGAKRRIRVEWPRNISRAEFTERVTRTKAIPGRSFVKGSGNDSHWTVPLDMSTCRALRSAFGSDLVIGPELRQWAAKEVALERNLGSLAAATSAVLTVLPERLPELYRALHVGPRGRYMTPEEFEAALEEPASYQCADVAFLAEAEAPANFNEMGTGKTIELIGSVFEAGMDDGVQLVVGAKSTLETVWHDELDRWQDQRVLVATGPRGDRTEVLDEALRRYKDGEPFWLVINPAMLQPVQCDPEDKSTSIHVKPATAKQRREEDARVQSYLDEGWEREDIPPGAVCTCKASRKPHLHYRHRFPQLFAMNYRTVIIDEAHRAAINNPKSLTHAGMMLVKQDKKIVATGTPMGGRPKKLFGILQYLRPDIYTSIWTWADRFLEIDEGTGYGKTILDKVREECRDAFNESLKPYVLRRTKEEVLDWLPPKQIVNIWCEMEESQQAQYDEWYYNADIEIGDKTFMAQGVLDTYTRLRQFAIAKQNTRGGKLTPTEDSCKLEVLEEILTTLAIVGEDTVALEQCVIFSQFTEVVDMVAAWLRKKGVGVGVISGKVKDTDRTALQRQFQNGELQVMVMNIKAGGVGINLDRASNVVFMDETWNPDDQDQGMDRCHRASRIHQVTCWFIRTKGTIEELVFDDVTGRQSENLAVLDERRGHVATRKIRTEGTRKAPVSV